MLYVPGSSVSQRCEVCGCNVFRKTPQGNWSCNGCPAKYLSDAPDPEPDPVQTCPYGLEGCGKCELCQLETS